LNYPRTVASRVTVNTQDQHVCYNSVPLLSEYRLDDLATGVRSPAEAMDFSSSLCVQTSSETHPVAYPVGTGDPFPGVQSGRDADHSPHLVLRSRMSTAYVFSPLSAWMACSRTALLLRQ
jgi:hypothetical protein